MPHLIQRAAILGTGLIGGSFAKALRKYTPDMHITGWDREEVAHQLKSSGVANQTFSGAIEPAIRGADLIYIALPIGVTLDILPEIAQNAAPHALVTDACSTKMRICTAAVELFEEEESTPIFLGGHPMAGRELSGFTQSDAELFQKATYALVGPARIPRPAHRRLFKDPENCVLWPTSAQQHDYAVILSPHLLQLTWPLGCFSTTARRESSAHHVGWPKPARHAAPCRQFLRHLAHLSHQPRSFRTFRSLARRLTIRERPRFPRTEADFDAANELYNSAL
jgi:prephenate dehydrogenase